MKNLPHKKKKHKTEKRRSFGFERVFQGSFRGELANRLPPTNQQMPNALKISSALNISQAPKWSPSIIRYVTQYCLGQCIV